MLHQLYAGMAFEIVGLYILRIRFNDDHVQIVDSRLRRRGEFYGPLRDLSFFNQVHLNLEIETLVRRNDADFDLATLRTFHLQKISQRFAESFAGFR